MIHLRKSRIDGNKFIWGDIVLYRPDEKLKKVSLLSKVLRRLGFIRVSDIQRAKEVKISEQKDKNRKYYREYYKKNRLRILARAKAKNKKIKENNNG